MSGIYPVTTTRDHARHDDGSETWIEDVSTPGLIRSRVVTARAWTEKRTDCYCCSCREDLTDAACRNHGWAARRPCLTHGLPGQPWDGSSDMPAPVGVAS